MALPVLDRVGASFRRATAALLQTVELLLSAQLWIVCLPLAGLALMAVAIRSLAGTAWMQLFVGACMILIAGLMARGLRA